jgi:hypothetical protein
VTNTADKDGFQVEFAFEAKGIGGERPGLPLVLRKIRAVFVRNEAIVLR